MCCDKYIPRVEFQDQFNSRFKILEEEEEEEERKFWKINSFHLQQTRCTIKLEISL